MKRRLILESCDDGYFAYYAPEKSVRKFRRDYLKRGYVELHTVDLDEECNIEQYGEKVFHICPVIFEDGSKD